MSDSSGLAKQPTSRVWEKNSESVETTLNPAPRKNVPQKAVPGKSAKPSASSEKAKATAVEPGIATASQVEQLPPASSAEASKRGGRRNRRPSRGKSSPPAERVAETERVEAFVAALRKAGGDLYDRKTFVQR